LAKCPVCKQWLTGFNWTTTKNNKKWLKNSSGEWHDCPKNKGKYESNVKWIKLSKNDYEFCELCGRYGLKESTHLKYPKLSYISKKDHLNLHHPNHEILDDIDFMMFTDEEKERKRKEWGWSKRTTPYHITYS